MYIIDLINLTINWHWEGMGTATRILKINSSQRTVLNLILNTLKLISAASKSWHVSQSRICIFSFCFFKLVWIKWQDNSRVSRWKWRVYYSWTHLLRMMQPSQPVTSSLLVFDTTVNQKVNTPQKARARKNWHLKFLSLVLASAAHIQKFSLKSVTLAFWKKKSFRNHLKR